MRRFSIVGLPVAATDYAGAVEWIFATARRGERAHAVEAANTHVAALARHDESFGRAMAKFSLIVPDGMPLVWALNAQLPEGEKLRDRVYGPSLMLKTWEASQGRADLSHFLFGGKESTLEKLREHFSREYPTAKLAGMDSPPFGEWSEVEQERIFEKIRASGANLVWVGLGCPKQERWIAENLHRLPPAVYFGIGAAFAFHAGEVAQAPSWIQRRGLEWAYRLWREPKRLFRRYFVYNSLFLYYLVRDHMIG